MGRGGKRREGGREGEGTKEKESIVIRTSSVDGEQGVWPGMRGGHQMCTDHIRGKNSDVGKGKKRLQQVVIPLTNIPPYSSPCPALSFLPPPELLYLCEGWDGSHDLGDLWQFDVRQSHWTCLCQDTSLVVRRQLL